MGESISALSAVSLIYIFMSVPVLHCLNYYSLRIKESVSLPVLFFKTGYLMLFAFPCKFVILLISKKQNQKKNLAVVLLGVVLDF